MSSTPYDIPALVENISIASKELGQDNGEARRQCLQAARSLTFALETPIETVFRHGWAEQGHHAALRACIDLNVFEKLDEGEGAKTSAEIAKMVGADPVLMERLLKHLAAMGSIYETGPNQYISTPFSKALKDPIYRDGYPSTFEFCGPAYLAFPRWLSKNHYKPPDSPTDCAFQLGRDTKSSFFEWLSQNPERLAQFQHHMTGKHAGRPSWMDPDFYPFKENLIKDAKTEHDSVFLVDIGGGRGHDLQEMCAKHPELPGKLVLQEVKGVIKEAEESGLNKRIVTMEHDFFTQQPITGARAYYLHSCLHDWADSEAHTILTSLRPSLTKGYSKLLLSEYVIPSRGAHWLSTAIDMAMLVNFSGCERTERQWRGLLEPAGFKIVKIWTHNTGTESLIEAEAI
ncbi:S-adenosyl-L-methionine-dependent methyltransferase [Usnea florida]